MRNPLYKYIIPAVVIGALFSCNKALDKIQPHNVTTSSVIFSQPSGYQRAMEGIYSLSIPLVNNIFFTGEAHGNNLRKLELQSTTAQSDVFNYLHTDRIEPVLNYSKGLWNGEYNMIVTINELLDNVSKTETDSVILEAKAEALFMRAFSYFTLVRFYGRPYYLQPDVNPGVPVITTLTTDNSKTARSTVKATYAQIISDLNAAIPLFNTNRGSSYASLYAAEALLSRVYLYMGGTFTTPDAGNNQLVITHATTVINSSSFTLLQGSDYQGYYTLQNTDNNEDIFATNTLSAATSQLVAIAGYYVPIANMSPSGTYAPSPDLLSLIGPADLRKSFYNPATYPLSTYGDAFATNKYNLARVGFSSKSPGRNLRLAEMYLNRAESYVKLGKNAEALADVNTIRTRAGLAALIGLTGQALFDEILLQRRIELAFEGQIGFDYYRNGLSMVRNYVSTDSQVTTVEPTSPKILLRIPVNEINLNPNLKQNEQ